MAFVHSLQTSRFELKYVIDEACAAGIRNFVRSYLDPDEYADVRHQNSYVVSSLYLDNAVLYLFDQTVAGKKNRFKLRIRFYDDNRHNPAFLEIKRRIGGVIFKERAKVTRDGVCQVLAGKGPKRTYLMSATGDSEGESALQNFCNLCFSIDAHGCIYVTYRREAYVSPESNQIRLTFDRELLGSPYEAGTGLVMPTHGVRPATGNDGRVILELKFTDRFPDWMRDLVHTFNLQRMSVPKYVHCIRKLEMRPDG